MDCLAPLDDPALLSVLAYFASSLVMIPLNREAAAAHPYTFILACFQCALTVLLLALTPLCCTRARWPRFAFRVSKNPFTLSGFRLWAEWLPVPILYVFMLAAALVGQHEGRATDVLLARSLVPLLAAAFELLALGTYYGGRSWAALLIVVLGGFAYVLFDGAAASADGASAVAPSAVMWLLLYVALATGFFVYARFMIARWALSVFDMCLLTQTISLIGFAIFAVFVDNPSSWWAFVARHTDALTWAWVVLSSLAVAAVSIATFAVLLLTSAASTALANDVVKTVAMVAAVASYGGPIRVELVLSAAAIGGGAARYAHERYRAGAKGAASPGHQPAPFAPAATKYGSDGNGGKSVEEPRAVAGAVIFGAAPEPPPRRAHDNETTALLGTEVADDLLRTNTDLKPAAAEADGPAPAADEEQGGIAPAAITFNWEVDGVTRELTVPDGASPDDEREFSFVAADGSTRYFVARIPGSLAPAAARPRSKRGLWRFMRR